MREFCLKALRGTGGPMKGFAGKERGAALLTVLFSTTLSFILIMTMLATNGHEVIISGLHRDSVRALELAQAGIQEGVRRLEAGRPMVTPATAPDFKSSLNSGVSVKIGPPIATGIGSAYREIQATAGVGKATRRLSLLVLQEQLTFPPNVFMADSISQPGNPNQIMSGDVYSNSFVHYQSLPQDPATLTNAAWRISLCLDLNCSSPGPGETTFCYTPADCATKGQSKWMAGLPRTEFATSTIGLDIQTWATAHCIGGVPTVDPTAIAGRLATDPSPDTCTPSCAGSPPLQTLYSFDKQTRSGVDLAVSPATPCGLPYKLVSLSFKADDGITTYTRLIKTFVFEQWFKNYWQFNEAPMAFEKKNTLVSNPDVAAIPPFPAVTMASSNYDIQMTGGGSVTPPPGKDFGTATQPVTVWMDSSTWTITQGRTGYGTMVIDGNLNLNALGAVFEYWGTIVVKGTLTAQSGQLVVHGGLIARNLVVVNGNFTQYGGGSAGNLPVGPSVIVGKAWWER